MKRTASAFVQIIPVRNNVGAVKDVRILRTTQTYPRAPESGALVVKLELVLDDDIFDIPTMRVLIDADPTEVQAAVVPVPVPEFEEFEDEFEDDDDTED